MAQKKLSAKARAAARKQKDKWKSKRWFTIRAPRHPWNFQNIGETIGETEEQIIGRVYEMTQQEFNGDFTKMHVKLRFRVNEVVGQDALTEFIGHAHQSDHLRRQIRRYRGKVTDVVDVVTNDGYLVRLKPLIITDRRIKTSVKQAIRQKTKELILGFAAKSTFSKLQEAILSSDLENDVRSAIKPIYPTRNCVISKSQLLQAGVLTDSGPTLDEIHSEEARAAAELEARKKAALEEAESGESLESEEEEIGVLAAAEAMESISESPQEETTQEETTSEEAVEEETEDSVSEEVDYSSKTVAELKELLKAAGKPVSGKKDDLIARLLE